MLHFYQRIIGNSVFAHMLLLLMIALGVIAATSMIRQSQPDIYIPVIAVEVQYPGASPEEVEEGVTAKIEGVIDGVPGILRHLSTSSENRSRVQIEIDDNYDISGVLDDVRNAVDSIDSFPRDVEKPKVFRETNGEQVMLVFVWGDLPERQLKELAEEVRVEIQALGTTSLIRMHQRDYEISVEISEEKLRQHKLTFGQITEAIRASSLNASAGTLRLKDEEVRIRALGKRYEGPDFDSIVVKALPDGEVITLGEVATIHDGFVEEPRMITFNGARCASLSIDKAVGEDAIKIYDSVNAYVEQKRLTLPEGVHLDAGFDNTEFIRGQIATLSFNGLLGLALIVFILWLFLEARLSFWVAMGIPISLSGALVLLWLLGATINQISLIGMIIVMGIVVDDAIVVGEAIYVHRRMGKPALQAAVDGVREVALPVFASVATTILAFLPMAFIPGLFGSFFIDVPRVIACALIVSLFECFFLLPAHLSHRQERSASRPLRRFSPTRMKQAVASGLESFVERVYAPTIRLAIRRRYITLCLGMAIVMITAGTIGGGFLRVIMWPSVEGDNLDAIVEYPSGTPAEVIEDGVRETRLALERVAAQLETTTGEPLIKAVFTVVPANSESKGTIDVELLATSKRGIASDEIIRLWREETGVIPGAISQSFSGARIGTGDGGDIDVWLQGRNFTELRGAANELKRTLAGFDGVFSITDDLRPGKRELHMALKPEAQVLGITMESLSNQLHGGYYGEEAVRIQRGREDVRVLVRYPLEERQTLAKLERVRIRTPDGIEVPLPSVADFSFVEGVSSIQGLNGTRGVMVSSEVDPKVANSHDITVELTAGILDKIISNYPGVSWSLSGTQVENQQILDALQRGFIMAMLAIFVILSTLFRSYLQPLVIMVIIPFGIVGAIWAHLLVGYPLSFLSLFGITALSGVLVNDSIVLIERINTNMTLGMDLHEAISQGGMRRFRAIILTSLSTCAGVAPLLVETSLTAQIVIPMVISLAGGLAFGTVITLIIIPSFLVVMNDSRRVAYRVIHGEWVEAEAVEPAYARHEHEVAPAEAQPT